MRKGKSKKDGELENKNFRRRNKTSVTRGQVMKKRQKCRVVTRRESQTKGLEVGFKVDI